MQAHMMWYVCCDQEDTFCQSLLIFRLNGMLSSIRHPTFIL